MQILKLFSCTGFDKNCCVCLSGSLNGFNFQLVGPTRKSAQTGISKFTLGIVVYK